MIIGVIIMPRIHYTVAVVCATLTAVALACSHNHPHAPLVALALAALSAGAFWRHRNLTHARI